MGLRTTTSGTVVEPPTARTTGWQPTCKHEGEPVPAVVLDPFLGSGTTAMVARWLGRHAVGIDLNPEYLAMAAERIETPAPQERKRRETAKPAKPHQLELAV
jgi:adenine-specific DNA methylase